ncbi:MAG: hypothetical protein E6G04_07055 [Actinobacteria bacterium]|nr:MAG: hypothetical protein E6G04_07055 [Actinomycetota bacterium]
MRARGMALVLAAIVPLAVFAPAGASVRRRPPVVNLVINSFRFCKKAPCSLTDTAYLRSPAGGSLYDNKQAFITIKAGSIVRWNYKDTGTPGCNQFNFGPVNCPGHEVRLENGTPGGGRQIGFAAARSSKPTSISWYIPPSYAGRTIHYFCNINNHWAFGLTGVLVITR